LWLLILLWENETLYAHVENCNKKQQMGDQEQLQQTEMLKKVFTPKHPVPVKMNKKPQKHERTQ
jgi:hypothetical protein